MGRLYIYRHLGKMLDWKMSSFMELFWVFGRVTKSSQFSARSVAYKKANQDLWNLVGGAPNLLHSTPTSPTSRLTRRNIKFSLWLGVPPRFWVVFCSDLNLGSALFWGAFKLQKMTPKCSINERSLVLWKEQHVSMPGLSQRTCKLLIAIHSTKNLMEIHLDQSHKNPSSATFSKWILLSRTPPSWTKNCLDKRRRDFKQRISPQMRFEKEHT